jgi:hypothetical protein
VEGYPLSEYVRPYLGPHIFSVFDRRDLRPSLRRVSELVGRSLRGTVSTDSRASKAQKV